MRFHQIKCKLYLQYLDSRLFDEKRGDFTPVLIFFCVKITHEILMHQIMFQENSTFTRNFDFSSYSHTFFYKMKTVITSKDAKTKGLKKYGKKNKHKALNKYLCT